MVMRRARTGETRPESLIVCFHWLWPGRNLLRGAIDRAGSAVLVVAFLAGAALVALAAGRWADAAGLRAEHPGPPWRRVHAVLRQEDPQDSPCPVPAAARGPGPSRMGCGQGTAFWRDIHAAGARMQSPGRPHPAATGTPGGGWAGTGCAWGLLAQDRVNARDALRTSPQRPPQQPAASATAAPARKATTRRGGGGSVAPRGGARPGHSQWGKTIRLLGRVSPILAPGGLPFRSLLPGQPPACWRPGLGDGVPRATAGRAASEVGKRRRRSRGPRTATGHMAHGEHPARRQIKT